MKLGKLSLKHFQSYSSLEFDLSNQGLAGIFGTTGAGKSTLMDALAWSLFGITGKGTAADEVRSWETKEVTEGILQLRLGSGVYLDITRRRGGAGQSDLHWVESEDGTQDFSAPFRGKDLKDTQKRLEERLGVTPELFLLSSYMTQFSEADSFFVASAKIRREVLEKIADQEWAIKLGDRCSEARKTSKSEAQNLEKELAKHTGTLAALKRTLSQTHTNAVGWDKNKGVRVTQLEAKIASYTADLAAKALIWEKESAAKLDAILEEIDVVPDPVPDKYFDDELALLHHQSRCDKCGSLSDKHQVASQKLKEAKIQNAHYREKLARLSKEYQVEGAKEFSHPSQNPYLDQFQIAKEEANPFISSIQVYESEIESTQSALKSIQSQLTSLQERISRLTWLYDKSFEMRGLLMERVVRQIEEKTNYYLEKFFDGALRVQFALEGSDKIEAYISNNGHRCPFLALSGGERTMLKLAFSLSLMRAAQNKAGIAMNVLMLDEPLNGLPEDLKVKAFGLFEELVSEYETILVIDHSEAFKNCFINSYFVDKVNGKSMLYSR